jgi:hypothetical protein
MAHKDRKQVALYLTEEEDRQITMYAKEIGISKQQLLSNLIGTSLDDLALLKRSGLLMIGKGFRNLVHRLRNDELSGKSQES